MLVKIFVQSELISHSEINKYGPWLTNLVACDLNLISLCKSPVSQQLVPFTLISMHSFINCNVSHMRFWQLTIYNMKLQ